MVKYSIFIIGLIIMVFISGCEDKKSVNTISDQKIEIAQPPEPPETSEQPEAPVSPETPPVTTQSVTEPAQTEKKPEKTTKIENFGSKTEQIEAKQEPKTTKNSNFLEKTTEKPAVKVEKPEYFKDCEFILTEYVDIYGNVNYNKLRRKRGDLIRSARAFSKVHPAKYLAWSKSEKTAFWINAYNIFSLKVVIDNYPIVPNKLKIIYPRNSIIHISGAWTKKYFNVMGIQYTLQEIEREIILQKFKDPRTCFTFSYATLGGAFLRNEPYSAEKLDQQLDDQVKKFINSPRGMIIDRNDKNIKLSAIFDWYKKDFIAKYGDMKKFRDRPERFRAYFNFIEKYLTEKDIQCLESSEYTVEFLKYDWQLNDNFTN